MVCVGARVTSSLSFERSQAGGEQVLRKAEGVHAQLAAHFGERQNPKSLKRRMGSCSQRPSEQS